MTCTWPPLRARRLITDWRSSRRTLSLSGASRGRRKAICNNLTVASATHTTPMEAATRREVPSAQQPQPDCVEGDWLDAPARPSCGFARGSAAPTAADQTGGNGGSSGDGTKGGSGVVMRVVRLLGAGGKDGSSGSSSRPPMPHLHRRQQRLADERHRNVQQARGRRRRVDGSLHGGLNGRVEACDAMRSWWQSVHARAGAGRGGWRPATMGSLSCPWARMSPSSALTPERRVVEEGRDGRGRRRGRGRVVPEQRCGKQAAHAVAV